MAGRPAEPHQKPCPIQLRHFIAHASDTIDLYVKKYSTTPLNQLPGIFINSLSQVVTMENRIVRLEYRHGSFAEASDSAPYHDMVVNWADKCLDKHIMMMTCCVTHHPVWKSSHRVLLVGHRQPPPHNKHPYTFYLFDPHGISKLESKPYENALETYFARQDTQLHIMNSSQLSYQWIENPLIPFKRAGLCIGWSYAIAALIAVAIEHIRTTACNRHGSSYAEMLATVVACLEVYRTEHGDAQNVRLVSLVQKLRHLSLNENPAIMSHPQQKALHLSNTRQSNKRQLEIDLTDDADARLEKRTNHR